MGINIRASSCGITIHILVMKLGQLGEMSCELLCCTSNDEWQLDRSCNCNRDQQDSRQQSSREMWRENETKQLRDGAHGSIFYASQTHPAGNPIETSSSFSSFMKS